MQGEDEMKRFLMTTALVAVGATGAFAQEAGERFRADNKDAIYASDFIGMRVYSTEAVGFPSFISTLIMANAWSVPERLE